MNTYTHIRILPLLLTPMLLIACGEGVELPEKRGVVTPLVPLNDTGVPGYLSNDQSYSELALPVYVTQGSSPVASAPGQDADFGASSFVDTGFRFTKYLGVNRSKVADDAPTFDCVTDEVTGLSWEHKNNNSASVHFHSHKFNWYWPDDAINGGFAGQQGKGQCAIVVGDTWTFAQQMNEQNYCGFNDWRLPTTEELRSLIDYDQTATAMTDQTFFPHVAVEAHMWTADTDVGNRQRAAGFHMHEGMAQVHDKVCRVDQFNNQECSTDDECNVKRFNNGVMLVRGGTSESPVR